jgi:sugar lactone lactonase YvrE
MVVATRVVAQTFTFTTLAGSTRVTGAADGAASTARFNSPAGIVADAVGNLYVVDNQNHTIRKVTSDGVVTTLAGSAGIPGNASGTGAAARFLFPRGIAVNSDGDLFVSCNHEIRRVTVAGAVTTFAGSSTAGEVDGAVTDARFNGPSGLGFDRAGNLYVTDSPAHTIRKITPAGVVSTFAGSAGQVGSTDGTGAAARFNQPFSLALDSDDNIYVTDFGSHTLRKITPAGVVSTFVGQAGVLGFTNGVGSAARLFAPFGVAAARDGTLYVCEGGSTIRKVTASGTVTTIGGSGALSGADDGRGTSARFNIPIGIAVDGSGNLYVTDSQNHTLRKGVPDSTPSVTRQPFGLVMAAGNRVALSVDATGGGLTYQWRRDGVNIPGATASTFSISSMAASDAASYTVMVSNPVGSAISAAAPVTLSQTSDVGRLVNLAIRTNAGTGAQTLIMGVNITGPTPTTSKPVLIRGVGPSLAAFGLTGLLADPTMVIYAGATVISTNDNWAGDTQVSNVSAQVGAFPLASASSRDAAVFSERNPGSYTVEISGVGGGTGSTLAEIYDASPAGTFQSNATARLTNVSARTQVGTGANILIAGFAIGGATAKTVLIRAVGPTLGLFGVSGVLADPKLELYSGAVPLLANDNWGGNASISATATNAGAFVLPVSSRDAALLVTLPPGSYTAQVSGVGNTTGVALVELYEVP